MTATPTNRTRRAHRAGAALTALGLTALAAAPAAAAQAPAPATAQAAKSPLKWGACPAGSEAPRGTYCTRIKVPLDYAKPNGRQIALTLSSVGDAHAKRTLVVNPGGPGESGIGTAKLVWSSLPPELGELYNVVSFDPRGVGTSTPVGCGDAGKLVKHPAPAYTPADAKAERARLDLSKKVADKCAAASKTLLPHITTANAARDMDRIRAALGRDKLDYLGYSYGSRLGATYATLFPQRTGRMVLDSIVDPGLTGYRTAYEQNTAMQKRARQFFAWTAKYDSTYHLGKTASKVGAAWEDARKRLRAKPAGGRAGIAELDDLLASVMYTDLQWGDLASAVAGYRRGDTGALLSAVNQLADSPAGYVNAAQLAYNCVDDAWPRDWRTWRKDTVASARKAPLFAWLNTWYSAPCAFWKAPTAKPVKIGATGAKKLPPILLLQAADDPATPLSGARRMRQALAGSRLVVAGGGNHGQFLFDANPCMDRHATRYLSTGKLPAKDATCKASPAPTP
ncbi:alpha/beta hydrolase [Streptomyces pathocidini]|uniref:alpha/beta hydrolase n=1 Tax=Streptomyces pathocidini TaxID=1650571 RepID=UPI00340250D3